MARKIIYCDLDGVMGDWEGRVLDMLNLENNFDIRKYLKQGGKLVDRIDEDLRDMIASEGSGFWRRIKPFYWADDMHKRLSSLGDFCFLTSSGDHSKRPLYSAGGAYGKLMWLSENFNGVSVSVCRDKYIHAVSNALLIDDDEGNVEKFRSNGGRAYLFPHPYKIEDSEVDILKVYREIEKEIELL